MQCDFITLFFLSAHNTSYFLPQKNLEEALQEAVTVLKGDGVIAIPTDTIYGVASLVSSNEGVERIYGMKGRQREKPLAICISDVSEVYT